MLDLTLAWRRVLDGNRLDTARILNHPRQFVDGNGTAGANVVNATGVRAGGGRVIGLGNISDIDKVASLFTIPVDHEWLAAEQTFCENRYHIPVGIVSLVDSVGVKVSQANHAHPVQTAVAEHIFLSGELADAVG